MSLIAYLNGRDIPAAEANVYVGDAGFLQGITISEQLRTFGGVPFQVDVHLDRLFAAVRWLGWEQVPDRGELVGAIQRVVTHNWQQLDPLDDLGVTVFVTPGLYPLYARGDNAHATVCVHTYPLPFRLWASAYEVGLPLLSSTIRQVSPAAWPSHLKCRSRMHYYLAAKEVRTRDKQATALLLHDDGCVAETPTANVIAHFAGEGLVTPRTNRVLSGVSLAFVRSLATECQLSFGERDLTLTELADADEILLSSTPFALLPVESLDGTCKSCPGPVYRSLLANWNAKVGFEIAAQALQFQDRR